MLLFPYAATFVHNNIVYVLVGICWCQWCHQVAVKPYIFLSFCALSLPGSNICDNLTVRRCQTGSTKNSGPEIAKKTNSCHTVRFASCVLIIYDEEIRDRIYACRTQDNACITKCGFEHLTMDVFHTSGTLFFVFTDLHFATNIAQCS